ncbi:MAG: protein kinase [Kofleriaceae bacterium]
MTTAVTEVFGPYIVYQRLGVGGMAMVHRALERGIEGFERVVALKRLLAHLAEDDSFVKSFVREAKLASLLNHVNIVQIYELGRVGNEYFISMEYVEGRDVRRILRQANKVTGPPPIQVIVGLVLQLCDALDYAHTKTDDKGRPLGIVHRDVSPSNLIVTPPGYLKVIDFGIAKAHPRHLQSETGRIKGKLAYMSPEAISGLVLDARSDVFSTGVVAHELITARPLFATKNEYQTMQNVERGEIKPPSAFNPACPHELDDIVLTALARDPADRFASAAALRDALTRLRDRYNLATDHRTIREWIEAAFSVDAAAGLAARPSEFSGPIRKPSSPPLLPPEHVGAELADLARVAATTMDTADRAQPYEQMAIAATTWENTPTPRPSGLAPLPTARATHEPPRVTPRASEFSVRDSSPEFAIGSDDPIAQLAQVWKSALRPTPARPTEPPPSDQLTEIAGMWRSAIRGSSAIPNQAVFVAEDPTIADTPLIEEPAVAEPAAVTAPVPAQAARRPAVWIGAAVVGAVGVAAVATVVTLSLTKHHAPSPPAAVKSPAVPVDPRATVKFVVEPVDAEILVEGQPVHRGAPWTTELAAGVHEVQIKHPGHRTWLTALELSANETQRIHVVLAPLTTVAAAAGATLVIKSTPPGLDVILDDKPLGLQTPIDLPLTVGFHAVRLEQDGAEVWSYELSAESSAVYEFNPVVSAAKTRDRVQLAAQPTPRVGPADAPTMHDDPPPAARASHDPQRTAGAVDAVPNVSAKAMKKLSGRDPVLPRKARAPAAIAVLLCTDTAGVVTSATLRTPNVEPLIASEVRGTLLGWKYAPYRRNGVAAPACFIVTVRR